MSYNIHHGRGLDDVVDLERIAEVIVESGAVIVALQEVDVGVERSGKVDIAAELARLTGLEHYVFGKNLDHEGGHYGVAVISGYPITDHQNLQFEKMGNEQRSIQVMKMNVKGFPLLMMKSILHTGLWVNRNDLLLFKPPRMELYPATLKGEVT